MKKRLCIALISPSKALTSILDTIGVWYESTPSMPLIPQNYALLIIEKSNSTSHRKREIKTFISEGGNVLEITNQPLYYTNVVSKKHISRLLNSTTSNSFNRIPFLDIYSKVALSSKNTILSGLVDIDYKSEYEKIAFIGLDITKLFSSHTYRRKRFHSPFGQNPDEIVSTIQRDAICDLVEITIQQIWIKENLPFLKKWHSPTPNPVFAFRIDSDYGTQNSLQKIYDLLTTHKLKATWFLHIQAHEEWLDFFKKFKHQELALHGYNHGYSSSSAKIENNIKLGLDLLDKAKIDVEGFCAPYAIWNKGLSETLAKFDFLYSSEFTRAYDALPFHDENEHMQIPIHPICTGSFSRIRYKEKEIQKYFLYILKQKMQLWKPVIFYHHPQQFALSVFDEVFEKVNESKLTNLTFAEFARFWNTRKSSNIEYVLDGETLSIESDNEDLIVYASTSLDGFSLITPNTKISLSDITSTFKYDTTSLPSPNEIEKLSENKLQLKKTSLLDWKNRFPL